MPDDAPQAVSPNPYDSPRAVDRSSGPAVSSRPTSALVFGILNILFAALGLVGLAASIVFLILPIDFGVPNPALDLMEESTAYYIFQIFSMILGTIFMVVLLAGGIGLVRFKPWGRTCSIAYGTYAIIAGTVGGVINFYFRNTSAV